MIGTARSRDRLRTANARDVEGQTGAGFDGGSLLADQADEGTADVAAAEDADADSRAHRSLTVPGAPGATRRFASAQMAAEVRDGARERELARRRVVHLGPAVVEERVVGARVHVHHDVLAEVLELLFELGNLLR